MRKPNALRTRGASPRIVAVAAILFLGACDDNTTELTAPSYAMRGIIVNGAGAHDPVANAQVTVGAAKTITDRFGTFSFINLPPGPAKLKVVATGFNEFEEDISVTPTDFLHNVTLARIERFETDSFSVYIPAAVSKVNAILLALGGPNTRGYAVGTPFGAPLPAVEASLQTQGEQFRAMAASKGMAIMGTSVAAMGNSAQSDVRILETLKAVAASSGRPDLADAPILMYGISGGAPEATGFTVRNASRMIGLFLKVPFGLEKLSTTAVPGLPTYVVMAELDVFVDNAKLSALFDSNRANGGLWAIAMERGVPHHALSPTQRSVTFNWMNEVLTQRLISETGIVPVTESLGWIGDPSTGLIAPSGTYLRDRSRTSWLPSQEIAKEWKSFTGLGSN
ncbi:MAG TPA: carboxypeptidase-like regulatory domain-containing protein [Gemmatimonadaceae bacterium]|nr:carboxypeptidase-like regulatory domain-containing protein [Gemmatimonadaceae bacterium]